MHEACTTIGRCVGCNEMRRLSGDACDECLNSPKRGPKWLELARRVRRDPEFASACYRRLGSDRDRAAFAAKYGLPEAVHAEPTGAPAKVIQFRR